MIGRTCVWPTTDNEMYYCSTPGSGGRKRCPSNMICGSNFDEYGNPRFSKDKSNYMLAPQNTEELTFGLTNFDNILNALIVIMQTITIEGWTDALYDIQDTSNPIFCAIVFILLVLIGNNFFLNLMLAVIWFKFEEGQDEIRQERRALKTILLNEKMMMRQATLMDRSKKKSFLKRFCYDLSNSVFLNIIIIICILINTITLSLDSYPSIYPY